MSMSKVALSTSLSENALEGQDDAFASLLSTIESRRDEFDRLRYVPREVVALMKASGIFRSSTPACFGGDARPPYWLLEKVEAIAQVDGSASWVSGFGSANT